MALRQETKVLKNRDFQELEDALAIARCACARFKSKVPYAGNLYDAAEDVMHACERMVEEASNI